jgi:hypothetical protein
MKIFLVCWWNKFIWNVITVINYIDKRNITQRHKKNKNQEIKIKTQNKLKKIQQELRKDKGKMRTKERKSLKFLWMIEIKDRIHWILEKENLNA